MSDSRDGIDFTVPAALRKWPSINNERVDAALVAHGPYLVDEDSLEACIRQFLTKPTKHHHLYEIHTAPQRDGVSAVLSAEQIVEIARFL